LKVGGVQREEKKKHIFVSWKAYFSSCNFFITPFHLHFKDDWQSFALQR
jgi:hypothetical protein